MDLTDEETRKSALASRSDEEIAALLADKSPGDLVAILRAAVRELGVYTLDLVKQERVGSRLLPPQTLRITLRESPRAARVEFVEGPSKGRKILFDAELRAREMRVKEPGILGIAGAIWLGLDNPLARADTNHPITDLGFGALLDFIEQDLARGERFGGHRRKDLGFGGRGRWSTEFTAPPGATGLLAVRTKLTFDIAAALPVEVETYDEKGLLEKYRYELVRKKIDTPADYFTPRSFGI
jgi:hypothetical protein